MAVKAGWVVFIILLAVPTMLIAAQFGNILDSSTVLPFSNSFALFNLKASVENPSACSSDKPGNCFTSSLCSQAGLQWCGSSFMSGYCSASCGTCSSTTPSSCFSAQSCTGAGANWCRTAINGDGSVSGYCSSGSCRVCSSSDFGSCIDSASCFSVGGAWYPMPSNWATYGPTGWCGAPGYTQPVCSSAMPDICSTENSCLGTGGKWCTVSAPSGTLGFCKSTACPTEQTTEVLRTFVFDKSGIAVIPLDDTKNIYFPLTGTGYIEVPLLDGTIYRYSANPADPPQPLPFPDFTGNIKIENSVIIHGYGQKRTIIVPNNPLGPVLVPMEGGGGFLVALKDSISGRVSGYYSMKGTVTMGEGNMIYSYKNNCIVSTTKKFSAYWKDFGSQLDSFINIKCPAMP